MSWAQVRSRYGWVATSLRSSAVTSWCRPACKSASIRASCAWVRNSVRRGTSLRRSAGDGTPESGSPHQSVSAAASKSAARSQSPAFAADRPRSANPEKLSRSSSPGRTSIRYPGALVMIRSAICGPSSRRSCLTCHWTVFRALVGGSVSHRTSIRPSVGTTLPGWSSSAASNARSLPGKARHSPSDAAISGPSTLNSGMIPRHQIATVGDSIFPVDGRVHGHF